MKTNILGLLLIMFGCLYIGFIFGGSYMKANIEPNIETRIVTEYVKIPEIIYKDKIVEKIVEVPVEVQAIVYQPITLRPFKDIDELKKFLVEDDTDNHIFLVAGKDGVVSFKGQCEDSAMQLKKRAEEQGFDMDVIPVGTYIRDREGHYILIGEGHALNSTIIGNDYIFIEPQTDEIWIGGHLD